MTKLMKLIAILALTFSVASGYGHHNHKHSVSKSGIQQIAKKELSLLVKNEKVAKSWADAHLLSTKEKEFDKFTEWVVQFENTKMKDKSKQNLIYF